MHVLDDLTGFSARAIDLLTRTGRREPETSDRTPTDFLRVRALSGRTIPAPMELVIRREGFHAKHGGLRYDVRTSLTFDGERRDFVRTWEFDLDGNIWADERGWYFSWTGERVSTPFRYLVHTDGRAGVGGGGPFIEVAASVTHLIEGHAIYDMLSSWDRWSDGFEGGTPPEAGLAVADRIEGLTVAAEASSRYDTWLLSEHVAVRSFWTWTSTRPRTHGVWLWARDNEGREQLQAAAERRLGR